MPQLTANFGPIPVTVTLDGSGNGVATFQPNGSNARITTLFVKVATAVNQANVNLYKGQVADSNIIGNTPSGSTGAPAFGNIDVTDGEIIFVVWTGGDAGQLATATFTGKTIPFEEVGDTSIRWDDPIAANDGSLVFPAIKSPGFQTGVQGWKIARDGTAEFNSVTVRGFLNVQGNDSSQIWITTANGQPQIQLWPSEPPSFQSPALLRAIVANSPPDESGVLEILSPQLANPRDAYAKISLSSEAEDGSRPPRVNITSNYSDLLQMFIDGSLELDILKPRGIDGNKQWVTGADVTRIAGSNVTVPAVAVGETTVIIVPSFTYKANRAYLIEFTCSFNVSAANNKMTFHARNTFAGTEFRSAAISSVNTGNAYGAFSAKFKVGGTDKSSTVVITASTNSAGFSGTILGVLGIEADVYEIGAATNAPNAPLMP